MPQLESHNTRADVKHCLGGHDSRRSASVSEARSPLAKAMVTLLGPDIEHRASLHEMLVETVSRINWLPDSASLNRSRKVHRRHRLGRLLDQFRGTSDSAFTDHVVKAIPNSDRQVIIAFWGTIPLPDVVAIKKAKPNVKIVLMLLCHPLALSTTGICRQNFFMRRAARYLDGIIYPSEDMASYFLNHVLVRHALPGVVIPPCWPKRIQAVATYSQPRATANLIYVGRTDLSERTVNAADDLRHLMGQLLDAGIEVHHGYSRETDDGHQRRKCFPLVDLPGVVRMMGQFDASLVAYNTEACSRDDRFRLTVPDRLITSVTAGVPIAIPKEGYSASKAYLKSYPAVIEFDSADSLARTLADRPLIASLRNAAWKARLNYTAAGYGRALQQFLEDLF